MTCKVPSGMTDVQTITKPKSASIFKCRFVIGRAFEFRRAHTHTHTHINRCYPSAKIFLHKYGVEWSNITDFNFMHVSLKINHANSSEQKQRIKLDPQAQVIYEGIFKHTDIIVILYAVGDHIRLQTTQYCTYESGGCRFFSVSEWVSGYSLTSRWTHNRSFRGWVFPGNYLHWYWQLKTNKRKYTKNTKRNHETNKLAMGKKNTQNTKYPKLNLNQQSLVHL